MANFTDSGLFWIGAIPEQWDIAPVRRLFNISRGRVIPIPEVNKTGMYPVYSSQTENNGCLGYIDTYDYQGETITWTTDGANAGTVFFRTGKFNCTNVCGILTPKNRVHVDMKFLTYSIGLSAFYNRRYDINGFKIMSNEMAAIPIVIPPLEEQKTISYKLDSLCSRIDHIIQKTLSSIEEYKNYKRAIITKAITRGIHDDIPLKDSGSVWFGRIPKAWSVNKLKYSFTIKKRIVGEDGHQVLAITQNGVKPKDMSNGTGQFADSYANYQIVHPGDFAMNHMDLLTGWVDISQYEGVTSPDYRVFSLNDTRNNYPKYYLYMMQMCYTNRIFYSMGQGVSGMGRWRLPADMFNNFLITVPPYDEQKIIAEYLDAKCAEIDNLISSKEKLISELETYKSSLIYEFVTGKRK